MNTGIYELSCFIDLLNGYLLKEGFVCSEPHIIEEGIIRSYMYDLEGNDVTTAFCSKQMFASDL